MREFLKRYEGILQKKGGVFPLTELSVRASRQSMRNMQREGRGKEEEEGGKKKERGDRRRGGGGEEVCT